MKTIEYVNYIENNYPVDTWKINNIHVWPIIRQLLRDSHSNLKGTTSKNWIAFRNKRIYIIISFLITTIYYIIQKIVSFVREDKKKVDVVLFARPSHRELIKNKYYIKLFYPLCLLFKKNNVTYKIYENLDSRIIKLPRKDISNYIFPALNYYIFRLFKCLKSEYLKSNTDLRNYDRFLNEISTKDYDLKHFSINNLIEITIRLRFYTNKIKSYLSNNNSKFALVICYYDIFGWSLCLACTELGIPCGDIQHGIAGKNNIPYGRWKNIPRNGYELLPSHFFLWGSLDAKAINEWSSNIKHIHKPIVMGNPWLEYLNSQRKNIIFTNIQKEVNNHIKKYKINHVILLTLDGYKIQKHVLDTIDLTRDKYLWLIRLHPLVSYQKKELNLQFKNNTNVNYKIASKYPLYSILNNVDIHITGWSATIFEAKYYNIPTIIVSTKGKEYFDQSIEEKYLFDGLTTKNILNSIESIIKNQKRNKNIQYIKKKKYKSVLDEIIGTIELKKNIL